ncbi:hypothetical protein PHYBLDRAFT_152439 [Phycomyces blakesleeanus NRRL 1555(-)]|uniref:Uncharacterized protein n=1 Tax=Phycomyces blakesleeanus (strain ATCC 8743b / DSM 1359 / FGSC 10004 / NBRC 33097 / NRRL 1555) TaxID=763407 RepID=A0A167JNI6_PHYB8|nr:hypothetical protein PHYBLDRAFT_152439 [Phycomyces blakesleeanus NRRL 1555(-)]OAD66367.1 hypothetical protein PHYBLDRAFT_152439 [Phycomyces blakesleeanus NRRL 1555(-)]|eukprot:XP_018284407.1 hypothetical protein PHYBLDRAFT_152439 [Phycomyces blakesleeanus NRRL 1555(-)]
MHNLFLGTAKRMMEKWREEGLITSKHLAEMQQDADSMIIPLGITPLHNKIGKGFLFMKADEWKSWCLVYSPVLLADHLLSEDLSDWMEFVHTCKYLARPNITVKDLSHVHDFLESFGQKCQVRFGKDFISPNMYLHLHLKETVLNFDPVYGYWLFSFERYNGVLKNYATNNKDGFEGTFMRRYLEDMHKINLFLSLIYELVDSFPTLVTVTAATTTTIVPVAPYLPTTSSGFTLKTFLDSAEVNIDNVKGNKPLPPSTFPLGLGEFVQMQEDEYAYLLKYYGTAYCDASLRGY